MTSPGTNPATSSGKLNILANLLLGRRRTGVTGLFDRRRQGGVGRTVNAHRGASALGTIATLSAPFVIRKLMERRAQRTVGS